MSRRLGRRGFVGGFVGAGLLGLVLPACSRSAPDATPEGAVRLWLEKMESSDSDVRAMKEAYQLLGPKARANLKERRSDDFTHMVAAWEAWNTTMLPETPDSFAEVYTAAELADHIGA